MKVGTWRLLGWARFVAWRRYTQNQEVYDTSRRNDNPSQSPWFHTWEFLELRCFMESLVSLGIHWSDHLTRALLSKMQFLYVSSAWCPRLDLLIMICLEFMSPCDFDCNGVFYTRAGNRFLPIFMSAKVFENHFNVVILWPTSHTHCRCTSSLSRDVRLMSWT